jgi:hypothetical protein
MAHTDPLLLSDAALEECVDGCTDLDLLRRILRKPDVVEDNVVDEYLFGDHFQEALEGFADDEEASENNYQWGCLIAENINLATTVKKSRRRKVPNPQAAWPMPTP